MHIINTSSSTVVVVVLRALGSTESLRGMHDPSIIETFLSRGINYYYINLQPLLEQHLADPLQSVKTLSPRLRLNHRL